MAFAVWQRNIVNGSGDVQASAFVEVRVEGSGSPLAVIYADRDGTTPLANPFQADADGFARFYVGGGAYRVTATKGAFSRIWRHVAIGTAQELDADLEGGNFIINYPPFSPNAVVDFLADRDAYDGEEVGFSVLVRFDDSSPPIDEPLVYFLMQTDPSPVWSEGVPFVTSASGNLAAEIHAASSKSTPVDADELALVDSEASNVLKKLTWSNLKATLKTYFDTLYQPVASALTSLASVWTPASASGPAGLQFHEDTDNGSNKVTLSAPATLAADRAITFPDAAGNLLVDNGQIPFPASQNASAGANTLDDYEEGTYTPSITGSGGAPTITYTTAVGTYTKIGRKVFASWFITVNTTTGGSGDLRVGDLPFTSLNLSNGHYWGAWTTEGVDNAASVNTISSQVAPNTNYARGFQTVDNAAGSALLIGAIANGDGLYGSITYNA